MGHRYWRYFKTADHPTISRATRRPRPQRSKTPCVGQEFSGVAWRRGANGATGGRHTLEEALLAVIAEKEVAVLKGTAMESQTKLEWGVLEIAHLVATAEVTATNAVKVVIIPIVR